MVTTAWKLAPTLAAGRTIILKPSGITLLPELMMGLILDKAQLPAGVVSIRPADGTVSSQLVAHPEINKISFIGSNKVGQNIIEQAASDAKNISLEELGGKSAIIVRSDASLEEACKYIISGIFTNCGKMC